MAFVPVPRTMQVNLRYEVFGQDMENTFYLRKPLAEWTVGEAETQLEDFATLVITYFAPLLVTDALITELYAVDLSDNDSWYIPYTLDEPGTVAQDIVPTSAACVITWQTAQRGRSFRGRSYIGGVPKTFIDNSLFTPTALGLYAAFATNYLALTSAVGAVPVVVSRFANGAERDPGISTSITDYRVNAVPGDQRRRRIGSGA